LIIPASRIFYSSVNITRHRESRITWAPRK
jgi:hypothetical protein